MTDQAMDVHDDHKLQTATESTLAKAVGRFVTPLLLGLVAYLGNQALNDIRNTQREQFVASQGQGEQIADARTELKLLNAKVDYSVLQQMTALDRRVQLLEDQNKILRANR